MMPAHESAVRRRIATVWIEDDAEWRETIRATVSRVPALRDGFAFGATSIEECRRALSQHVGPVMLLVDLQLGGILYGFSGYHWLLDELEAFRKMHHPSEVFVVSGNLSPVVRESLVRKGVPTEHVFDKGEWSEQRTVFVERVAQAAAALESPADLHETADSFRIDPYLRHKLKLTTSTDVDESGSHSGVRDARIALLVTVRHDEWNAERVPELSVLSSLGRVHACIGSRRSVSALNADEAVVSVEASRPSGFEECVRSVPFVRASEVHSAFSETGTDCIVAVIDSGFDVLHPAFRSADGVGTRILRIWDQADSTGPHPAICPVGTEYSETDVMKMLSAGKLSAGLSKKPLEHGTHVASIAAGSRTSSFGGGVAPGAGLVLVIPDRVGTENAPMSLGYSASHHAALKYVSWVAETLGRPIVVNVSQGQNAGAHDGTTGLERGFDSVTNNGERPGVVVVKSAGNEREGCCHATFRVVSHGAETLSWESREPHDEDYLELWFRPSDRFAFRLVAPSGELTAWIGGATATTEGVFASGNRYYLAYTRYHVDNGDSCVKVVVSSGAALHIAVGTWRLDVAGEAVRTDGEIQAWIEKNGGRPVGFKNHVSEGGTLSIPGTANYVIGVGAVAAEHPYRLAAYSSYGPTRDGREKPEVSAPGEAVIAAVAKAGVGAMSGTSMAAPHVAGAIALVLSQRAKQIVSKPGLKQFNAAQIRAAIVSTAQGYQGNWHPGLGYGVLDAAAFLAALI